jgi:hypothetical protein
MKVGEVGGGWGGDGKEGEEIHRFEICVFQISVGTSANLVEIFRNFLQSLQKKKSILYYSFFARAS